MEEKLYPMKDYEEYYSITKSGKVWSNRVNRFLKTNFPNSKYLQVHVTGDKKGGGVNKYIHRFVAKTFIPNPENKPCINHKDFNRQNNHVSNLEWVTHKENSGHAMKYNRYSAKKILNERGV